MGYTTEFVGAISLSRKLTLKEAKEWLEMADADDTDGQEFGGYIQWVPSTSLDSLVWDNNEKFYDYVECLGFVLKWLGERGIVGNGELYWSGEENGDTGKIVVVNSVVTSHPNKIPSIPFQKPLTLSVLGKMLLDDL